MSNFGSRIFGFFATSGGGGGGGTVTPNPTDGYMPYNSLGIAFDDSYWVVDDTASPPFTTTTSIFTLDFGFKLDFIANIPRAYVGDFVGNVNECFITVEVDPVAPIISTTMNGGSFFGFSIFNGATPSVFLGEYGNFDILLTCEEVGIISTTYLSVQKGLYMDMQTTGLHVLGDSATNFTIDSLNQEIYTKTNSVLYGFYAISSKTYLGDTANNGTDFVRLEISGGGGDNRIITYPSDNPFLSKGIKFDMGNRVYQFGTDNTNFQIDAVLQTIKTRVGTKDIGLLIDVANNQDCLLGDYSGSINTTFFGIRDFNECLYSSLNLLQNPTIDGVTNYLRIIIDGDPTIYYLPLYNI